MCEDSSRQEAVRKFQQKRDTTPILEAYEPPTT
jgi:hypothetical protein